MYANYITGYVKHHKIRMVSRRHQILGGGDTSVTNFFRDKTSAKLAVQFLPIVKKVTDRSGLFTMIGEEEKAIRADPIGSGSKLIGKVFGALR